MFMSFQPHIYERDRRLTREAQVQRQGSDDPSLSPTSSTHSSLRGGELQRFNSARSTSSSDVNVPRSEVKRTQSMRQQIGGNVASETSPSEGVESSQQDPRSASASKDGNGKASYRLVKLSLGRSRRNLAADVAAAAGPPSPLRNETDPEQRGTGKESHTDAADTDYGFPEQPQSTSGFASWLASPLSAKVGKGRRSSTVSRNDVPDASRKPRAGSGSNAPPLPQEAEALVRKHSAKRPAMLRSASSVSARLKNVPRRLSHDGNLDAAVLTGVSASQGQARNTNEAQQTSSSGVSFNRDIFSSSMTKQQFNGDSYFGQGDLEPDDVVQFEPLSTSPQQDRPARHQTHAGEPKNRQELHTYPLPVRLGLVLPDVVEAKRIALDGSAEGTTRANARQEADLSFMESDQVASARMSLLSEGRPQYCQGYYLVTPPPRKRPSMRDRAVSSVSQTSSGSANSILPSVYARRQSFTRVRANKKPSTAFPEGASLSVATPLPTLTEAIPPGRGRTNISVASERSGQSHVSSASRLDETKAWQLEDYFRIDNQRKPGRFGLTERKLHAYPASEAPYFMAYGKNTVTAEILIHTTVSRIMGLTRVPLHDRRPPRRVLDLGCGSGAWVLEMAKLWPETEFIGLDLVPCQTPIETKYSDTEEDKDIASRVSWVVANLLEGLPFADQSFDFVHTSFINTGIPEAKWPSVLHDIVRILVPDGHFELLEVDWTFYGAPFHMYNADYEALLEGRLKNTSEAIAMWESQRMGKATENSQRYASLAPVMRLPYERRRLCLSPTTLLPSVLNAMGDLGDAGFGNVRRVPILGRSRLAAASEAAEQAELASGRVLRDADAPRKPEVVLAFDAFVTHADPERPLPRHRFLVEDMDALRLAILGADILRNSEIKDLLWNDVQHASKLQPGSPTQWATLGSFERDVDEWSSEMRGRTDVELLLKNTERWDEAAERMDGWMQEEKQRKKLRKRRWAAGPTPFAHALSPLPDAAKDKVLTSMTPDMPISPSRANFLALPALTSSDASVKSSIPSSPEFRDCGNISTSSDEESAIDEAGKDETPSPVDSPVSKGTQGEAVFVVDKWSIPPTQTFPKAGNSAKSRTSSHSSNRDNEHTIPILGFRNVCAWSFHKMPPAFDTPKPDRQKALPDVPDEMPAGLEDVEGGE